MADLKLNRLEEEVLECMLSGDDESLCILRNQLKVATVANRKMTGVGFFLEFAVPQTAPCLPGKPSVIVNNDMQAQIEGLKNGAGFVLWVKDGCLDQLEGYCFGEPWPRQINAFNIASLRTSSITSR